MDVGTNAVNLSVTWTRDIKVKYLNVPALYVWYDHDGRRQEQVIKSRETSEIREPLQFFTITWIRVDYIKEIIDCSWCGAICEYIELEKWRACNHHFPCWQHGQITDAQGICSSNVDVVTFFSWPSHPFCSFENVMCRAYFNANDFFSAALAHLLCFFFHAREMNVWLCEDTLNCRQITFCNKITIFKNF